uniref:Slc25a-36 n=1 Tax=Schmidtea mediterranea TaxID=79327 RepID=A0A0H3YJE2_SCHMD|nr:slc25a-36 [Schmidtea mediterranea]
MQNFTYICEEMILGGSAASFACIFTNPLEVVKTRLQLQGELKSRGTYAVHYKNFFHAFYAISKSDGLMALQNGLVSGLLYQFVMNGTRLGSYQMLIDCKLHMNKSGDVSYIKALLIGASCGAFGAFIGSPLYLVKTHHQVYSKSEIAVGYQRKNNGMVSALKAIYKEKGIRGLWRGWQAQVIRVMVGSSAQLSTFSMCKQWLHRMEICDISTITNSILASFVGGIVVTLAMAPFDVLSTRIYNQPLDTNGKGIYYSGIFDALTKVFGKEGFFALYKGSSGVFFRLTPHTVIMLVSWDRFRLISHRVKDKDQTKFSTG